MKIFTFSEKDNPYMKRKELVLRVEHPGAATPSAAALQQYLAKEWGVAPEQVDIKGIYSLVGKQASRLKVFLWQEKKVADLSKPKEEKPPAGQSGQAQSAQPAEAKAA